MRTALCNRIKSELCAVRRHIISVILSMIVGAVLILFSWFKFGGPCKTIVFFTMPGGSVAIAMYYVLWFIMFTLFGGESVLIKNTRNGEGSTLFLLHIASHICLFLWYPLFFTTFSQLLSLIILISALVLLILKIKEERKHSILLTISTSFKIAVSVIFIYINISFIILN